MTVVFNASPLIVLCKAGLADKVIAPTWVPVIPQPVADEITAVAEPTDPAKTWVTRPPASTWIRQAPEVSSFIAAWDLGAGESSVISLTKSLPGTMAVLDDLAAQRCAQALGLRVTGTLGLILMAKSAKLLPSVSEALDAIVAAGLFISKGHLTAIREKAGES